MSDAHVEKRAVLLREMLKAPNDHTRIRDETWYAEWLVDRGVYVANNDTENDGA